MASNRGLILQFCFVLLLSVITAVNAQSTCTKLPDLFRIQSTSGEGGFLRLDNETYQAELTVSKENASVFYTVHAQVHHRYFSQLVATNLTVDGEEVVYRAYFIQKGHKPVKFFGKKKGDGFEYYTFLQANAKGTPSTPDGCIIDFHSLFDAYILKPAICNNHLAMTDRKLKGPTIEDASAPPGCFFSNFTASPI